MIAEISVIPQVERSGRQIVAMSLEEIAAQGLRYEVGAGGTAVEGELEEMLAAMRGIVRRLREAEVDRAVVELRLQLEPHPETLQHQVEGVVAAGKETT